MNSLDQAIIEQLEEGWSRWKIAENLGLGETTVRRVIKRLCEQYQCSMKELPEKVKGEHK